MGSLDEREPTDISGYLRDSYKNVLVFSWKEAIQETERNFESSFREKMLSEWETTKKKLMDNFRMQSSTLSEASNNSFRSPSVSERQGNYSFGTPRTPLLSSRFSEQSTATPLSSSRVLNTPGGFPVTPTGLFSNSARSPLTPNLSQHSISDRDKVEVYAKGISFFYNNRNKSSEHNFDNPLTFVKFLASVSEKAISKDKSPFVNPTFLTFSQVS